MLRHVLLSKCVLCDIGPRLFTSVLHVKQPRCVSTSYRPVPDSDLSVVASVLSNSDHMSACLCLWLALKQEEVSLQELRRIVRTVHKDEDWKQSGLPPVKNTNSFMFSLKSGASLLWMFRMCSWLLNCHLHLALGYPWANLGSGFKWHSYEVEIRPNVRHSILFITAEYKLLHCVTFAHKHHRAHVTW